MAARAEELGDVGENSPAHWMEPCGSPDVHVALAAIAPDGPQVEAVLGRAGDAYEKPPGIEVIYRGLPPSGRLSVSEREGVRSRGQLRSS